MSALTVSLSNHIPCGAFLWNKPKAAEIADERVKMNVQARQLGITFRRDLSIDLRAGLRFDYTIQKNHTDPLKFIYCAQPLLNGTPTTRGHCRVRCE